MIKIKRYSELNEKMKNYDVKLIGKDWGEHEWVENCYREIDNMDVYDKLKIYGYYHTIMNTLKNDFKIIDKNTKGWGDPKVKTRLENDIKNIDIDIISKEDDIKELESEIKKYKEVKRKYKLKINPDIKELDTVNLHYIGKDHIIIPFEEFVNELDPKKHEDKPKIYDFWRKFRNEIIEDKFK